MARRGEPPPAALLGHAAAAHALLRCAGAATAPWLRQGPLREKITKGKTEQELKSRAEIQSKTHRQILKNSGQKFREKPRKHVDEERI
jgi:hypothetical protein